MSRQKVPFVKVKPKKVKDAVWAMVVEAWENGLSDREASFRVQKFLGEDLKADDIRQWCKDYPDVGELRANLQSDVLMESKLVIADAVKSGDIKTAKWYAERKGADEFSTKQAVAFEGAVVELSLEEKERALKDMMEKFHNGEQ